MEIQFLIKRDTAPTKDVLMHEIARLAEYIQVAAASGLHPEPPHDGQICIGRIYEVTIDDIKVPCVALIVNAVICLPGMGGRVSHRLENVLVPAKGERWHRSVLINGRSRPCFVIRLSDFNENAGGFHLTDDQRRILDRVHRAIASHRYYLVATETDPVKLDVLIDGVPLTPKGLAKMIKDRKRAGRASLAAELAIVARSQPSQHHDLAELLAARREVVTQARRRLAALDDVIDKVGGSLCH